MSPAKRSKKAQAKAAAVEPSAGVGGGVNLLPGADRKAALGTKHACFACEAKFYDMNKPEPICPRCGADQRKRPKTAAKRAPPPAPPPERAVATPAPTLVDDDEPDEDEADSDEGFLDDDMEIDLEGIGGDDDDGLSEFPRSSASTDDDDRDT